MLLEMFRLMSIIYCVAEVEFLYFVGENFTVQSFEDFCVIAMFGYHLPYREGPCLQSGVDPRIKDPSSRSPALGRGQDMLDKSLNVFL